MLPLLFTVFIDSLGFGLVFPIFTPLIMNNEGRIFSDETSLAVRGLVFGFLVSAYCIGQFLGGPLLGTLSDRYGRKKVLIGAMLLALVGYLLAGGGLIAKSLTLLFLARLFGGLSAGSFAVCQSAVADQSSKEEKGRKLALVGTSFWIGFVIGPFVGGRLSKFGILLPFTGSAIFALLTAFLLLIFFKESLAKRSDSKIAPFEAFRHIKTAFTTPDLRGMFLVMFIFCIGWGFFTEFSPVFLIRRLSFDAEKIGNFFAWIGLCIAISQGVIIRQLLKRVSPERLLPIGLVVLGSFLPILLLFKTGLGMFVLAPIIALSVAMIFPTSAAIVSNLSSPETQGEILGIHNSVQWAAIAIPPFFSGSLVALYPHLPISVGSITMLFAFFLFLKVVKKKAENI